MRMYRPVTVYFTPGDYARLRTTSIKSMIPMTKLIAKSVEDYLNAHYPVDRK